MELDLRAFDVRAAIDNCRTLVRERAFRHQVKVDSEVGTEVGTWTADERKFKQVLLNLLTNGVKFTPPGGDVRIGAAIEDGMLALSVADTGIGIDASDQGVIFEEFRQVRAEGEAKQEGTGLGLALSRRLVELHGGTLTVESEPGRGSTFTARFPRQGS